MTEDFLQFIWKFGLFDRSSMYTASGEAIQVIGLGEHSMHAGPDFINARIQIGATTWAGNVEVHVRASDWYNHKHHTDKAFDNVILHVVMKNDMPVIRNSGEEIPVVELHYDHRLYSNYTCLMQRKDWMPCGNKISVVDPFLLDMWLNSLVVERLQQKTGMISTLLNQTTNNWEETFYICLARSFGFGLNALPFEMTARSLPRMILSRHRNSLFELEALLLGQAGFLDESGSFNDYFDSLRSEYLHLKVKYNIHPIQKHLWKFLRLRPMNFPTIRLVQFAALMQLAEGMLSKIVSCRQISEVKQLFDIRASSFWDTHFTFDSASPPKAKILGADAILSLVINTAIPFLFIYGSLNTDQDLKDRALEWLTQLPPEKNSTVSRWATLGISASSAFYTQALLQLSREYCLKKRCLACSVGAGLIMAPPDSNAS